MKIYHYSAQTGEYQRTGTADINPLNAAQWLIPAHATALAPPTANAHQIAVFESSGWTLKPDWRGVRLYLTRTGNALYATEIGQTPDSLKATPVAPPSPAHLWKETGWVEDPQRKAAQLAALKMAFCHHIDSAAEHTRRTIAGDPLRIAEYALTVPEAQAYKAADYPVPIPATVKSWADAKGWSGKQAADDILDAHTFWQAALLKLRDLRLKGKATVQQAPDGTSAQKAMEEAIRQIQEVGAVERKVA